MADGNRRVEYKDRPGYMTGEVIGASEDGQQLAVSWSDNVTRVEQADSLQDATATYSLRKPFTLEDARALLGKRADITVETDSDEGATEIHADTTVQEVYQRPGTGRGYLGLGTVLGVRYVPFGDVREVANVREQ